MFSFWNHWNVDDDLEIWLVSLGSTISWFSSDIFCKTRTCRTRHWTFLAHVQRYLEGVPFKKLFFYKLFILSRICNINFIKYVWARILNVFSQKKSCNLKLCFFYMSVLDLAPDWIRYHNLNLWSFQ